VHDEPSNTVEAEVVSLKAAAWDLQKLADRNVSRLRAAGYNELADVLERSARDMNGLAEEWDEGLMQLSDHPDVDVLAWPVDADELVAMLEQAFKCLDDTTLPRVQQALELRRVEIEVAKLDKRDAGEDATDA